LWNCQYCGSSNGMYYKDGNLEGMLCLESDCGRFTEIAEISAEIHDHDI